MLKRASLAARLAVYVALATVVLGAVVSTIQIYADHHQADQHLREELPRDVAALSWVAAQATVRGDAMLGQAVVQGALQHPAVIRAVIEDAGGRALAAATPSELADVQHAAIWRTVSDMAFGPPYEVALPLTAGNTDGLVGTLRVLVDPISVTVAFVERIAGLTAVSFANIAIIALVLYGVAYLTIARPLARVAAALTTGASDPADPYRIRIDLPDVSKGRQDELGRLVAAVNALLQVIERAVRDLGVRDRAIGAISQGVVIGDPSRPALPTLYANEAFGRMTGHDPEVAVGQSLDALAGPDTDPATQAQLREALRQGEPYEREVLLYRKDGRPFWAHIFTSPVRDEARRLTHFVAVLVDITDHRNLEMQLRQAQKMEAIGQLTGGVAHDFNNLLTVILGNAEFLADRLAGDALLHEFAATIQTAALRGADLTQHLLAYARRQTLQPAATDVGALLKTVEPLLQRSLGEDVIIEFLVGPDAGRALVDSAQLQTALLNLAINARDAMPDGGRLVIEVAAVALDEDYVRERPEDDALPGAYVMVAVSDTGTGMPPAVAARAFEPFFTTKEVGKGSGLGLSMVYGFVKQSGGHARIYSEEGHGTTVKLYLPRAGEGTGQAPDAVRPEDAPRGRGERVLVVEDDTLVRGYVAHLLTELGYKVVTVADAREALERLERDPPDLMFSDVVMPGGMDGMQLAERARQARPGLKVLLTSGYTEASVMRRDPRRGAINLLMKPYRRADLAQRVRAALDA